MRIYIGEHNFYEIIDMDSPIVIKTPKGEFKLEVQKVGALVVSGITRDCPVLLGENVVTELPKEIMEEPEREETEEEKLEETKSEQEVSNED